MSNDAARVKLPVDEIHYIQDSILYKFSDGTRLTDRYREMLDVGTADVPPIGCVYHAGRWWALDNRRLFLFKKLHSHEQLDDVDVLWRCADMNDPNDRTAQEYKNKYRTRNGGTSVAVRGNPNLNQELDKLTVDWKRSKDEQFSTIVSSCLRTTSYDDEERDDYDDRGNDCCWDDVARRNLKTRKSNKMFLNYLA